MKKFKTGRVVEKTAKSAEGSKILLVIAALVIVIAGFKYAADFILPILLAFFIAAISYPITNLLKEHRVPDVFALMITVIVDFAFLTGVVFLGIVLTTEFQSKWESKYQALTEQRTDQLIEFTTEMYEKWGLKGKEDSEEIPDDNAIEATEEVDELVGKEIAENEDEKIELVPVPDPDELDPNQSSETAS